MNNPVTTETHGKFLEVLRESENAKWVWARWVVENRGMEVLMQPTGEAPSYEQWEDYSDSGDILARIPGAARFQRYEVRHLIGTEFSTRETWPYRDFIVSACHSFDRADPEPDVYFCLNPQMTHVAYVKVAESRELWHKKTVYNSRFDREQTFYYCPLGPVRFMTLEGEMI